MKTKHQVAMLTVMSFLLGFLLFPSLTFGDKPLYTGAPIGVYMEIDEITTGIGEFPPHENEVLIEAVAHGISQPYDPNTGGGNAQLLHKALHINKSLDQISPLFSFWLSTGHTLEQVTLRFYLLNAYPEIHFYTILLEDAIVRSYDIEKDGQHKGASETVSFVYRRITWTDEESGHTHTESWEGAE